MQPTHPYTRGLDALRAPIGRLQGGLAAVPIVGRVPPPKERSARPASSRPAAIIPKTAVSRAARTGFRSATSMWPAAFTPHDILAGKREKTMDRDVPVKREPNLEDQESFGAA
jgi:hypothetical protein